MTGGESGDLGGEKISEKAVFMIEAKVVAVGGFQMRGALHEPDFPFCVGRLRRNDGGGGAIAEEAGADENAGVVVEIGGSGTNFHANNEGVAGLAGGEEGGGLLEGGEGGAAAEADEIKKGEGGGESEALGKVAGESGAEVAGTGGDEEGIDVPKFQP